MGSKNYKLCTGPKITDKFGNEWYGYTKEEVEEKELEQDTANERQRLQDEQARREGIENCLRQVNEYLDPETTKHHKAVLEALNDLEYYGEYVQEMYLYCLLRRKSPEEFMKEYPEPHHRWYTRREDWY